jgi:hypothetical protein
MVERHDCGKIVQRTPRVDHGPPEVVQKRMLDAGKGDPALTSYPLGLLLARGMIAQPEHDAGCRLAWHRCIVYGKPTITASRLENVSRGTSSWENEELVTKSKTAYLDAQIAVERYSRVWWYHVYRAAISEIRPQWSGGEDLPAPEWVLESRALVNGLRILAVEFGKRRGPPVLLEVPGYRIASEESEGSPMERRA